MLNLRLIFTVTLKELKKVILDDLVCLGKAGGLHSFEQVSELLKCLT